MKEVFPGIFLIKETRKLFNFLESTNLYVIAGNDGLIYDSGYGNRSSIKFALKELNKIESVYQSEYKTLNLTRILPSHSHSDHISGLKELRKRLGLKILVTKEIAEIICDKLAYSKAYRADNYKDYFIVNKSVKQRLKSYLLSKLANFFWNFIAGVSYIDDPDEIIDKDSEIIINGDIWRIFPSPGHSFDHISLYNEQKGILFAGDNIFKSISGWLGPPESNLDEYMHTLETYNKLNNLRLILPAHGDPIENPKERIKEAILHRENRLNQVLDLIRNSQDTGLTPKEIIENVYTNGSRMIKQIARGWVCLSIKKLELEGSISRKESKEEIRFYPVNKL